MDNGESTTSTTTTPVDPNIQTQEGDSTTTTTTLPEETTTTTTEAITTTTTESTTTTTTVAPSTTTTTTQPTAVADPATSMAVENELGDAEGDIRNAEKHVARAREMAMENHAASTNTGRASEASAEEEVK